MDKMTVKLAWLLGTLFLFSFSCGRYKPMKNDISSSDKIASIEVKTYKGLETNKGNFVVVLGTITQEEFINKGGHSTGIYETLIKLSDGETVHIRNKGENKYDYANFVNKEVKLEAFIFYGNIDSDNPEHQSRVGYRIDYTLMTLVND